MQEAQLLREPVEQRLTRTRSWAARLPPMGALIFGITILYFVGFSSFPRAHNAAHDTRHASGFPCH
jgi:cobalt transporter subunit CbtB